VTPSVLLKFAAPLAASVLSEPAPETFRLLLMVALVNVAWPVCTVLPEKVAVPPNEVVVPKAATLAESVATVAVVRKRGLGVSRNQRPDAELPCPAGGGMEFAGRQSTLPR
jgi:hypothetical protein